VRQSSRTQFAGNGVTCKRNYILDSRDYVLVSRLYVIRFPAVLVSRESIMVMVWCLRLHSLSRNENSPTSHYRCLPLKE